MKKISHLIIAACLSFGLLAGPINVASAAQKCYYVAGHWKHGVWYPKHRVCYYGKYQGMNCKWVKGHYEYGRFIPAHKVCWRR